MLSLRQVQDVCYNNKLCRYLHHEINSDGKFVPVCLKKATALYNKIIKNNDPKHEKFIQENSGDNCPGYRYMLHIEQGYDVLKK